MKKDWEIKKLSEVCEINIGRTPERGNSKMWDKEKKTKNVWLSIADLNNAEDGYISDSSEYVSDNAVPKMKLVKANTLLMSFKLTIGRCAITKRDLFTNEAIAALPIIDKDLNLFFLKYYLENFDWAKLTEGDVKVKGKTLNKEKLKEVPIILPPLEEQKRIVKILDEKFAQLETIKVNAQTNLQNAKDLFQSQLAKAFSNTTWEKKKLETIAKIKSGFAFKGSAFKPDGEYQVLRLGNVKQNYLRVEEKAVFVSGISDTDFSKAKVNVGDLVVTQTGTKGKRDYGFVAIVDRDNLLLNQRLAAITTDDCLYNRYLLYYSYTESFKDQFFANEGGTVGQGNIGLTDIKEIEIPLPPLPEQKRIVKELDALSEKVRQLQEIYTKQIANCDELKQSLLQKAFEGEL